jgi:hypothetical protein
LPGVPSASGQAATPAATNPAVTRVLLRLRERVAQAVEEAYRDLDRLGVPPPAADLLLRRSRWDPTALVLDQVQL